MKCMASCLLSKPRLVTSTFEHVREPRWTWTICMFAGYLRDIFHFPESTESSWQWKLCWTFFGCKYASLRSIISDYQSCMCVLICQVGVCDCLSVCFYLCILQLLNNAQNGWKWMPFCLHLKYVLSYMLHTTQTRSHTHYCTFLLFVHSFYNKKLSFLF